MGSEMCIRDRYEGKRIRYRPSLTVRPGMEVSMFRTGDQIKKVVELAGD